MEQKQIHLANNIKEFENQKTILENYIHYLFILLSNLKENQVILNKVKIALENPNPLLLFFIPLSKDDEKDFKEDSDSPN